MKRTQTIATMTSLMRSRHWLQWNPRWKRLILKEIDEKGFLQIKESRRNLVNRHPFLLQSRPTQVPPPDLSRTWLLSGGRGAGKTRAGAEWVRWAVPQAGYRWIALVAPNFSDVREVMIEGPSGLIWTAKHKDDRPVWQPSRRRLEWQNGAVAYGFSAEDPDSLRGPQFDLAWCDEAAAWARGEPVWDNLQLALRLGPHPLAMVTTTPRPTGLIRRLKAEPMVVETRTRMADNAANLAPGFVDVMQAAHRGTQLGRQELDGEMIDDPAGAMFDRARIDALRVSEAPLVFDDCIVAVDPNISAKPGADARGIILAGVKDGVGYVLGDASAPGLKPLDWALRAVHLAEIGGASQILAEANRGGDMVREVIAMTGTTMLVRLVSARLGKRGRAQPIAALYKQCRVHHHGTFHTLEDQMCRFGTPEDTSSPDRVDALVWALCAPMVEGRGPRVRVII